MKNKKMGSAARGNRANGEEALIEVKYIEVEEE